VVITFLEMSVKSLFVVFKFITTTFGHSVFYS